MHVEISEEHALCRLAQISAGKIKQLAEMSERIFVSIPTHSLSFPATYSFRADERRRPCQDSS